MARKSRKNTADHGNSFIEPVAAVTYRAALYARISVETEEKIERDSIGIQVALLKEFAATIPDLVVEDIYIDDDVSGSDFNRPDYERMMQDIDKGRINCIIVKDLSRFARNHIGAGEYLEKIFPEKGVRFIAVTDNIDTLEGDGGIIVPFKNVLNERYAKESSIKLMANFKVMQKEGLFCSSIAPYGYLRSEEDKHRLVIDEEAATVVKQIYAWFVEEKKTIHWMTGELERRGIPCPAVYMQMKGIRKKTSLVTKTAVWSCERVRTILKSRMYCGDMVQNKSKSTFLQTGRKDTFVENPKEEWIIVCDTHEAIISREMYQKAQEILECNARNHEQKKKKSDTIKNPEYCLKGVMVCAHCGSRMTVKRRVNKEKVYYWYICPKHDGFGNAGCEKKNMSFENTNALVFQIIKRYMNNFLDIEKALEEMQKSMPGKAKKESLRKEVLMTESKIRKINQMKSGLYQDLCDRLIDESDYRYMSQRYSEDIEKLNLELESLLQKISLFQAKPVESVEETIRKHVKSRKLNSLMVSAFVEKIIVDNDGRFEVEMKLKDEYEELLNNMEMMKGVMQSA